MRPIWTGALSFGLVNIPVRLQSAVQAKERVSFRLLHKTDLSPIRYERVCEKEGDPVEWDDIVKGYEYTKGKFVALSDDDFESAADRIVEDDRDPGFREGGRDRSTLLRNTLLPRSWQGRRKGLRAASGGDQTHGSRRHRQDHAAHERPAPGGNQDSRRRHRARRHALRDRARRRR